MIPYLFDHTLMTEIENEIRYEVRDEINSKADPYMISETYSYLKDEVENELINVLYNLISDTKWKEL